jgi:hypothetical protein
MLLRSISRYLWRVGAARLNRLRKKSEKDAPSGLKSARRIKNKLLIGTTEVVP